MKGKLIDLLAMLFILCGLLSAALVWAPGSGGLGLTNLNNTFVFGLWIMADLALIALGSGAFCTAALYHIFKLHYLRPLLPISITTGLLCYGSAGFILLLEIGQPLRAWFPFLHPNFSSMLTEITFCITLYSGILFLEFLPVLLNHPLFRKMPRFARLRQKLVLLLPVLAGVGAIVSLMHQGSLGGVYGVMFARPFSWRPGIGIWPWTCLLFIVSAIAAGPLFMALLTGIIERAAKVQILTTNMLNGLGKCGALCLTTCLLARAADILLWKFRLLPAKGLEFNQMFHGAAFGKWLIVAELGIFTLLPLIILSRHRLRTNRQYFFPAAGLTCLGLITNRYVINLQTLAVPTLPFEAWEGYYPNWVEIAPLLMTAGLFFLAIRFLFKQGLLFPHRTFSDSE